MSRHLLRHDPAERDRVLRLYPRYLQHVLGHTHYPEIHFAAQIVAHALVVTRAHAAAAAEQGSCWTESVPWDSRQNGAVA